VDPVYTPPPTMQIKKYQSRKNFQITVEVVKIFYNIEEVSRAMPGKKRLHIN
jgi:hypothetical protein